MKYAFSNIAWDRSLDERVANVLVAEGFNAVEIAPTKYWNDQFTVTDREANEVRKFWNDRGLEIVAMQSLLFNKLDLKLFESDESRVKLAAGLKTVVDLAAQLGATKLVFGSPKNRARGPLSPDEAKDLAISFFRSVGDYAHERGCFICLEANARAYGCDFINTSKEAIELVDAVGSKGFKLHLDVGNMVLENENLSVQLSKYLASAKHFHISRPKMVPLTEEQSYDRAWAEVVSLKRPESISVEMLVSTTVADDIIETIQKSASLVRSLVERRT